MPTTMPAQAQPMTMEIMTDLVSRSWSRAYDIDNATEDFAVDAMMYQADKDGVTLRVSIELAELQSALLNLPVVRADLSNADSPIQARYDLLHALIGNEDFNKITVRLATHSTRNPRNRRYLQTIQWLINKFSRHMGESMVTVTTAAPLTDAQSERLAQIYSKKVGRPVHIHSVVDETVMGGMRIQMGDEVTDNTVVAQLQNLKRTVKAGTND